MERKEEIEFVDLELIDDNPYQVGGAYSRQQIADMAVSIKARGLLQKPLARRKDGRVQLGFGHLRKRGFEKLAREDSKWAKMPLVIKDLTDEEMALFALDENLTRHNLTPMEIARGVDNFLIKFPNRTETDLAKQLNMTQGNISNMRRVLRLPEQILEKIDTGRINFTMGRELLIFQGLPNEKDLMLEAIRGLRTEGRPYGEPNTVEGIQRSIHGVARMHFYGLERGGQDSWYSREPLFDTNEAGCFQCEHVIRTHPTKSTVTPWCINRECWEQKQQAHKDKVAAEAKAKMEEDVMKKVAGIEVARTSGEAISQEIRTSAEDHEVESVEDELGVSEVEEVLEEELPKICHGCLNVKRCDRTCFYTGEGGELTCDQRVTKRTAKALREKATVAIPEELRPLIQEKVGTRAEVLDIKDLLLGDWQRNLKEGYALLSNDLDRIAEPEECLERCTVGFHYAFDSTRNTGNVLYVCTHPKCLAKKKAAFTRAKNAAGQAKKNAERAAIKQAVQSTESIDRARMKLIILAQLEGYHVENRYHFDAKLKSPQEWFAAKINFVRSPRDWSSSTSADSHKLIEQLDKLSDEEMAKLIVEFMLESLTDKRGKLENYEIQTTAALNWIGITVKEKTNESEESV